MSLATQVACHHVNPSIEQENVPTVSIVVLASFAGTHWLAEAVQQAVVAALPKLTAKENNQSVFNNHMQATKELIHLRVLDTDNTDEEYVQ